MHCEDWTWIILRTGMHCEDWTGIYSEDWDAFLGLGYILRTRMQT